MYVTREILINEISPIKDPKPLAEAFVQPNGDNVDPNNVKSDTHCLLSNPKVPGGIVNSVNK